MSRVVSYIFVLMGTLLVSLMLWLFIMGGRLQLQSGVGVNVTSSRLQQQMWFVAEDAYRDTWDIFTGSDGRFLEEITEDAWNSASDVS